MTPREKVYAIVKIKRNFNKELNKLEEKFKKELIIIGNKFEDELSDILNEKGSKK